MNFQQLRIIRETVRRQFNLTEVANALFTSQSGVSKHIKDLEDELGVELFVRKGKRLLGLTEPGSELVEIVERMLLDAGNIKRLAEHPVVTYHEGFTGRARIDATFARAGLLPDIVMSALDADVIKTYVELGLGAGIIASVAFDPVRDSGLRLLDSEHLFEANTTLIALRRKHYLRSYAYRFIELCEPSLNEVTVKAALKPSAED